MGVNYLSSSWELMIGARLHLEKTWITAHSYNHHKAPFYIQNEVPTQIGYMFVKAFQISGHLMGSELLKLPSIELGY